MTRTITRGLAIALCLAPMACGAPRFKDQPIVWQVDDGRNIPEPEENEFLALKYYGEIFATRRITRSLDIPNREPAHNTNALDEVPDSTWFTNRIGRRDYTPQQAAQGPVQGPLPQPPFTLTSGKSGGGNPGFIVQDRTGRHFIIKFDAKENPEMQTGGNVVVNRILWTVGYNVPADYVFEFLPQQISIADDATHKDDLRRKQPFSRALLEEMLEGSPRTAGGSYRATASLFLDGVPKGGWALEGTRSDDPNDRIAHEHRRELRALRVVAAWLNHSDMKLDNTLDMYVTEGKRRFLKHYLVDFGEALGGHPAEKGRPEDGYEHLVDWTAAGAGLVSFGLWKRTWEDTKPTPWPAIGWFSADLFDPAEWHEAYPYWPFQEMDDADAYWGAKLVMRFTRPMLKAIVAEAKFSHPGAAAHLVNALYARRTKIGQAYLMSVAAFDALRVEQGQLCGYDLAVHYRLATHGVVEWLDDGDVVDHWTVSPTGRACLPLPADDRYQVYRLRIRRGAAHSRPMEVHLKGGKDARLLGIVRVAE
jgi:hypothetical protein